MIRDESKHPTNQSNAEVIGQVSGGFSLSERQCTCGECGDDLEHGDTVTVFAVITCPSIYHRWSRRAYFCRECSPSELDEEVLSEYRRSTFEVLVKGTLRDKGYWGTYSDGDGGWEKRWTYQDKKWAEFAGTQIKDRRGSDDSGITVTDVGPNQFGYNPAEHGKTIPVPAGVLEELIEHSDLEYEPEGWARSSDHPLKYARDLVARHGGGYTAWQG